MTRRIQKTSTKHFETPLFGRALDVVVLYTSVELVKVALKRAEELAEGMDVRVRLVSMQIVPYPLPVDQPSVNLQQLKADLEDVSDRSGLEVHGDIVLARDIQTALRTALKQNSIVVLASHRRPWRTQEESLQKQCIKAGHDVILCYAR